MTEQQGPTSISSINGGVKVNNQGDASIQGDVVGRDKVVNINVQSLPKANGGIASPIENHGVVVVVPTGGKGESLQPITEMIPKSLVPIGRLPMLQHILNSLSACKDVFRKVIVLTRAFSDAIEESVFQGQYGNFVECQHIEKHVPDALLEIRDQFLGRPILLHYTDILIEDIQWKHVYSRHLDLQKRYNTIGTLLCSKYYPLKIGVIREGRPELLSSFEEKPPRLPDIFANLGVSLFESDFLDYIEPGDAGIFEQSLSRALNAKRNFGLYAVGEWHHVDSIKDYHRILQSPFGRVNPIMPKQG